jgi:predicted Zn-ribbon and HTH transcriptional regulator
MINTEETLEAER